MEACCPQISATPISLAQIKDSRDPLAIIVVAPERHTFDDGAHGLFEIMGISAHYTVHFWG